MSRLLTKQQIVDAQDIEYVEVDCPEWGGAVRLRSLTGKQLTEIVERGKNLSPHEIGMRTLASSAVDAAGNPLFTLDDLDALSQKSSKVLTRLGNAVQDLNNFGKDEKKQEEAVKND